MTRSVITAGGGFLLAVLWFDLMFDVQLRGNAGGDVPEHALNSIAAYYRRVTTDARPMNRLIALTMLGTVIALTVQFARGDTPRLVSAASGVAAVAAIGLAGLRTVPNAIRLGARGDAIGVQSSLARSILRDHLFCFAAISSVLLVQLIWG